MNDVIKPAILCVDDEPHILSGLQLLLRKSFDVLTADGGTKGVEILKQRRDIRVVVSDLRMPNMDGIAFLREAHRILPDAPRILLTGHADIDSAIAAVNDGQIFRFLIKPCPPETVLLSLQAGCEQYRLITAERVLLGKTLNGTIKVLSDVLAMTAPHAFGHATRVKTLAGELTERVMPQYRWAVELASMLAPLGSISLPDAVLDKIYGSQELAHDERRMVEKLPELTDQLLTNIPRLDLVRAILALVHQKQVPPNVELTRAEQPIVQRGADILRVAIDFDALDAAAHPTDTVIATLRSRAGRYDPAVLSALDFLRGNGGLTQEIRELSISSLREGMTIAADVRLPTGALLIARGFEVTQSFIERTRNLHRGSVIPVKVYVKR